uniref:Uncharacterized protein n=1 Tax=Shewanella glacialipiscicola TaxID=614069 RepID=A0ABQ6J836_9GAMM|nr:hypothetical protein GCM10025855_38140 [Shewanella glacialipiscicola]
MRARAWFKVQSEASTMSEKEKLLKVNNFFNLFNFVDDIKLWGNQIIGQHQWSLLA